MDQTTLLQRLQLDDDLASAVDERTLEILARRRRTAVVRRRGWLVRRLLLAADLLGLSLALIVAEWIINAHSSAGSLDARDEVIGFLATLPCWVVVSKIYGLYDRDEERTDHSTADEFAGVFHMVTVCTWLFAVGSYLTGLAHPTAPKLTLFWGLAVGLVAGGRALARAVARRNPIYLQNAVIVGAGSVGQLIAKKILRHPEYGVNLVGLVDANPKERRGDLGHLALLGGAERLPALVQLFDIERIIVAFSNDSPEETLAVLRSLKGLPVQVDIVPRLFETVGPSVGIHMLEGLPLISLPPTRLSASSALIKRTLDIAVATVLSIVLLPVLLLIAVAIKLDSPGPILYRHARVGRGRRSLKVLKFRTMRLEACRGPQYGGDIAEAMFDELMRDSSRAQEFETGYKFAHDPRVTRVGALLRKSSLDELPQLFNVLLGHLSLVGPRAITIDELDRYGADVDELLSIRPGVTGYWQINGRSSLAYEDRVRLDLSYIAGWSLRFDMEILAKTARVLVTGRGAR